MIPSKCLKYELIALTGDDESDEESEEVSEEESGVLSIRFISVEFGGVANCNLGDEVLGAKVNFFFSFKFGGVSIFDILIVKIQLVVILNFI